MIPTLHEDAIESRAGRVGLADLPDPTPQHRARLKDVPPIIERLWRIALADVEACIADCGRESFLAEERDVAFAAGLGLSDFFPSFVDDTLAEGFAVRLDLGWRVARGSMVGAIDAPWEEEDCDEAEFARRYGTAGFAARTDDVVRWWAMCDLLMRFEYDPDRRPEVLADADRAFRELYEPLFDAKTGLYRGQPALAEGGSPLWRATSTNALYVAVFDALAHHAGHADRPMQEAIYEKRAEDLRAAMNEHLRNDDGTWAHALAADGTRIGRRDALGAALVEQCEVPKTSAELKRGDALRGYPVADGAPLFFPDADDREQTCRPFVESLALRAWNFATNEATGDLELALLARSCTTAGTFHGTIDYRTGRPTGPAGSLLTASAFLGAAARRYGYPEAT